MPDTSDTNLRAAALDFIRELSRHGVVFSRIRVVVWPTRLFWLEVRIRTALI